MPWSDRPDFAIASKVVQWFTGGNPLAAEMRSWSSYNYVYNNPIKLIDPLGLAPTPLPHDYFDSDGNYFGSDDRGNEIRIVTDKENFNMDSDQAALDNSVEIDGINLTESAVGNIGSHYLESLGRSDLKVRGLSQAAFPFMAVTQGDGSPEKIRGNHMYLKNPTISISMGGYGAEEGMGKVSSNLRDINNFVNTLFHETLHFNLLESQGGGLFKDVVPIGDYWELGHAHMHNMQMAHSSWEGTTPLFKRNHGVITRNNINRIKNSNLKEFARFSVEWTKNALK